MKKHKLLKAVIVLLLCLSIVFPTEFLQAAETGSQEAGGISPEAVLAEEDKAAPSPEEMPEIPQTPDETAEVSQTIDDEPQVEVIEDGSSNMPQIQEESERELPQKTEELAGEPPQTSADEIQPDTPLTSEEPTEKPTETEEEPSEETLNVPETPEEPAEEIPDIRTFENQFVRGGDKTDTDGKVQYLWNANTNASGHRFIFRVNYDISGIKERPAGNIRITIPHHILKDRTGNFADTFEMSLPELQKDPETGAYYPMEEQAAYFETGTDYGYYLSTDEEGNEVIIVTNLREVPAAQNGYFEIAYQTTKETWEYPDMGENMPFTSKIQAGESEPLEAEPISVVINTNIRITSTDKRYPTLFKEWNTAWGEKPDHAEDYYYLVWEIASRIDNGTQPYDFTLDDFEITGSETGGTVEVVGYKLSGEPVFSDKNTAKNQTGSGYRYDYVLTRHDKAHYGEAEINIQKYWITNKEKATVIPADGIDEATSATATRTFTWERPAFVRPNGHFYSLKYGNNNWHQAAAHPYHWDYAYYDLDKFQEETVDSIDAFRYDTWGYGYPYPWTVGDITGPDGSKDGVVDGWDADNPNAYGQKPVTYVLSDSTLYFEEDVTEEDDQAVAAEGAVPISKEDYELLKLDPLQVTTKRYIYDDESKKFVYSTSKFEDTDILEIYGELYNEATGEKEWVLVGTLNLGTGATDIKTGANGDYLTSLTSSEVLFNSESYDFTGYKLKTSNAYYYTSLRAYPIFRLKNSDLIMERTKTDANENGFKDVVRLANVSDFHVYDSENKEIYEQMRAAIDRAIRSWKESELKKEVVSSGNDARKKQYTIRWKISQSETVITGTGTRDYIRQDAGTFYDLLPSGAVLEKESLYVMGESGKIDDSYIDYRQIPNYKDSGRTMLVIHVNKQESHYTAFYNTVHTWDSMGDWGVDVLNPVAYGKENKETKPDGTEGYTGIADGFADDGGTLTQPNKELMSNLDASDDENAKRFLYDEQIYQIDALTAAMAGLKKQVKAEEESAYSYDSVTKQEGNYSYQLRFQNTHVTKAKDMIFFDSLENYVTPDGNSSEWKGMLTGIDVSQLKSKGIAPVCYISEEENLNLDQNHDLTDTAIWKEVDADTDLGSAKAVAIDMRKTKDNSDFILESGDSVTAVLHMRAPKKVADTEKDTYPKAYNNIYIEDTVIGNGGSEEHFFIHQDYTTIYYRVTADLKLQKLSTADETVRVPGATYRISGESDYGQTVDMTRTTNQEGVLTFKDIEKGTYTLRETGCSADWQLNTKVHTLKVDGFGDVYVDGEKVSKEIGENGETALWVTKDEPRIHADISFSKRNANSQHLNEVLAGAEFKLSGTSDYGNEIILYAESTGRGRVTFTNIELGTYELKETKAPEGYLLDENVWKVNVDENGNVSIRDEKRDEIEKDTKGTYIIRNEERYHGFQLHKVDANESYNLKGAEFTLTGISELGTKVTMTAVSDESGIVTFKDLEKGTYLLQETKAPFNYSTKHGSTGDREENPPTEEGETIYRYDLDETKYPVVIDAEGNVTIKGVEEDNFGFVIKNYRHTEKIRIIKKWVDMDEEVRTEPVIHVSHKDPNIKGPILVFEAGEGRFDNHTSSNTIAYDSETRRIITGSYLEPIPPTKENGDYIFDGWYLDNETYKQKLEMDFWKGVPKNWQDADWEKTDTIYVYAKYRKINVVNYVVSLYGIEADTLADGSVSGLTFGPTTWSSWSEDIYNHSHEPTGKTEKGKHPHRCIHNDSWKTIIEWSKTDPYVYEQCYGDETTPSCTKVTEIDIPSEIKSSYESTWNMINRACGYVSMFDKSLISNARQWSQVRNHDGGWAVSNARAILQILLTAFPEELQTAIAEKQVAYNTGGGSFNMEIKNCNDKLWLLAESEIYGFTDPELLGESQVLNPTAGKNYERFQKIGIKESRNKGQGYEEWEQKAMWWLRSPDPRSKDNCYMVDVNGDTTRWFVGNYVGLAPAFCLPGPSRTGN